MNPTPPAQPSPLAEFEQVRRWNLAKYDCPFPSSCEAITDEEYDHLLAYTKALHAAAVRLAGDMIIGSSFMAIHYCGFCNARVTKDQPIPHTPECPAGLVLGMDGGKK